MTKINYNSLDLVSTSSSSLKVKFSLVRIEYNSFAKASLSGLYGLINCLQSLHCGLESAQLVGHLTLHRSTPERDCDLWLT